MVFTENTRLQEICQAEHLLPIRDCLISGGRFFEENGTRRWCSCRNEAPPGTPKIFSTACGGWKSHTRSAPYMAVKTPAWPPVKLTWLPHGRKSTRPLLSCWRAGHTGPVCTMAESLPVAARLNELGYSCFCLNYPHRRCRRVLFTA